MEASGNIVVVKVGSSTLVGPDGTLDRAYLEGFAAQIAAVKAAGWRPIVVSSAAIACGVEALGMPARPDDMPSLQAAASVGQVVLAEAYANAFGRQGIAISLVLLTRHDTAERQAYLHARDTLLRLVELDVVPVVNENDTTSVEEIRFGDNDTLAAIVSCLVKARHCVVFSDVEGLYSANPATVADAQLITRVDRITPDIMEVAGGAGTTMGSGGMATKVKAARVLMMAGIPLTVCHGKAPNALIDVLAGRHVGTLFAAGSTPHEITNYKLWIALGDAAKGAVVADEGAVGALQSKGSSLLCVGVTSVEGRFDAGDVVDVKDPSGRIVARGKVGASSDEVDLARGLSTAELLANRLLAPLGERPLIHRDELVVFE